MKIDAEKKTMKCVENKFVVCCLSKGTAVVALPLARVIIIRVTMDIFQHRYYKLSKRLMSLTGQWPYYSFHAKCGITVALLSFGAYNTVDQQLTVIKYRNDWNILLDCFAPTVFQAIAAVKYFGFMCNSRKMLKLLDRIRMDWQVWARQKEVKIIHEYAEQGEKITIAYTVMVYSVVFVFMIQPMITKLINIVMKNDTEPGTFPYPVSYDHFDVQKYYFYFVSYSIACGLIVVTIFISNEVILILYVQHVCGIFAAVGHTLQRIGSNYTSTKTGGSPHALDKKEMVYLVSCINRHNDAIEYANLIKSSYAWNLFFTVGFGMILVNVFGLQVLLRTNDLGATGTLLGLTLGTLFVFYVECHISQICIDHSISIRFYIQNSKWYRLSVKNQKILQFMTMRCNIPCQLIAGNMLTMSAQTFGLVCRTAMSYFAFIRSAQGI